MVTQLNEFKEEEKLLKKLRQKKRIRGCLIIANALLLSYFSYLVVDSIVKTIKEKNQILTNEIIQLNGFSLSKTKETYNRHISSSIDVNDFATYGKYLLTSEYRVDYANFKFEDSVRLVNLISEPFVVDNDLRYTLGDKINNQIDLFSLNSGDYMLCKDANLIDDKFVCYHYAGMNLLETTIYSFPDENNHRKKITIKGKDSSPAIIVSVEDINLLPSNYYDFIIIGEKENFDIFQNTNYQVRYVSSIKEAYSLNSSYALNLIEGEQTIVSSNYVDLNTSKPELIQGSAYNLLDKDDAIRELGGYLFNAGYGVSSSEVGEETSSISLEIKKLNKEMRNGKLTLSLTNDYTLEDIETLLSI